VTEANPVVKINKKSLDENEIKLLDANERSALKQLLKIIADKR